MLCVVCYFIAQAGGWECTAITTAAAAAIAAATTTILVFGVKVNLAMGDFNWDPTLDINNFTNSNNTRFVSSDYKTTDLLEYV